MGHPCVRDLDRPVGGVGTLLRTLIALDFFVGPGLVVDVFLLVVAMSNPPIVHLCSCSSSVCWVSTRHAITYLMATECDGGDFSVCAIVDVLFDTSKLLY
jgi:hypothetical protein